MLYVKNRENHMAVVVGGGPPNAGPTPQNIIKWFFKNKTYAMLGGAGFDPPTSPQQFIIFTITPNGFVL